jgi:hypothetical protein
LGGRKFSKSGKGGSLVWILSPIINAFLELGVDGVSYHSGDYRTERIVHSFNVVFHVGQIHIIISMYYIFHI